MIEQRLEKNEILSEVFMRILVSFGISNACLRSSAFAAHQREFPKIRTNKNIIIISNRILGVNNSSVRAIRECSFRSYLAVFECPKCRELSARHRLKYLLFPI